MTTLGDEYAQLWERFRQLEAEHALLKDHPEDIAGHDRHRHRLSEHIEAIRRHIQRLRESKVNR